MYTLRCAYPLFKLTKITQTTELGTRVFNYNVLRLNKQRAQYETDNLIKPVVQSTLNTNIIVNRSKDIPQHILDTQQMTISKEILGQDKYITHPKLIESIISNRELIVETFKGVLLVGAACVGGAFLGSTLAVLQWIHYIG